MDEDRLAAALRGATDDVQVPGDLVRRAERLGRERRARRRSVVTTLAVGVVVLAGGALVVPQIGSRGGDSASSGGAASDSSAAGSSASSAPPAPSTAAPIPESAPRSAQQDASGAESRAAAGESATCDPPLTVEGVPAREGYATSVPAGQLIEVTGSPLCGPVPPGTRYSLVLARVSQEPTVLADVAPASDGSFSARVTVPPSTLPRPTRLSVVGSTWVLQPCPDTADCTRPDYGADLDVLPAGPAAPPSTPTAEESP